LGEGLKTDVNDMFFGGYLSKKPKRVKCPKCGFENLPDASFCSGCGARLKPFPAEVKGRFEALSLLLLVGSVYLFVSLAVNVIMQVLLFDVPSFVSAVLGVYAGYRLYKGGGGGVIYLLRQRPP
jgi:hypothetical protein